MKPIILNLSILLVLITATSRAQWASNIGSPSEFAILDTCRLTKISQTLKIKTSSDIPVKIYSLKFNHTEHLLLVQGKEVNVLDTFFVSKLKPLNILINLKKPQSITKELSISYVYEDRDKYQESIDLHFGDLVIRNSDIKSKKEQIIDFSKICSDSLKIYFPYGGTTSSVAVYKNASSNNILRHLGYLYSDPENYMVFTKADRGKYYVKFSSCYWASNFWLVIK
jgi:hypothetical protein